MIGEAEYVCLIDFGGCHVTVDGTETSKGAYTPCYKAPECDGVRPVRASADVYTVGTTMVALLIGRTLTDFASRESQDASIEVSASQIAVRQIGRDPLTFSPKCSPDLLRIVRKALSREPSERQASAAELARELEICRVRVMSSRSRR